jgi:hypothetical protein
MHTKKFFSSCMVTALTYTNINIQVNVDWQGICKEITQQMHDDHKFKSNEDSGIWNIQSLTWTISKMNHQEFVLN